MGARSLIVLALAVGCRGPDPSVRDVVVARSPEPGHQRVELVLANAGRHGEVTLEITLRGQGGRMVRDTRHVDIERHEQLALSFDIAAPADAYAATVKARYPD